MKNYYITIVLEKNVAGASMYTRDKPSHHTSNPFGNSTELIRTNVN